LAAAAALAQTPDFSVEVKLVRILASVKNQSGQPIGSLTKEDFQISDNSVPQELTLFEHHTEQPLSIALMIDTSLSTMIDIKYEIESVSRFLRALFREGNPQDTAALFAFNWQTTQLNSFTRHLERMEHSLKGLRPEGGTSMYDAITLVSHELDDREGRRVIVIVTDGGDTTSARNFHEALEAAQRADAVLYPILVVPVSNEPGRNIGGENALTLLAAGTGGRVFAPTLGSALDSAFTEILRDLRTQYLIGYYPKNVPPAKDPFHRLEVRLRQPDLRVSARSGYYEETQNRKTDDRSTEDRRGWRPVH